MKKSLLTISLFLITLSSFASSRYGESDNTFPTILMILIIVVSILQIILFFKIWGMTNNVKSILSRIQNSDAPIDKTDLARKIRKEVVCGNKETAKNLILQNFYSLVIGRYYNSASSKSDSIEEIVAKLKTQLDKIDTELPKEISLLKTYDDFFSIITSDDLKM